MKLPIFRPDHGLSDDFLSFNTYENSNMILSRGLPNSARVPVFTFLSACVGVVQAGPFLQFSGLGVY